MPDEHPESRIKPAGWVELRRCLVSGIVLPHVLLHPRLGIVVLDGPPDAVALLRRRLDQARFAAVFPGTLPIVQLAASTQSLAEAFEGQPKLGLPNGDAWVGMAHRALEISAPRGELHQLRFRARRRRTRWRAVVAGGLAMIGIAVGLSAMSLRSGRTSRTLDSAPAANPAPPAHLQ
jgi:hypothetical protein